MIGEYYVKSPSTYFYESPDLNSPVTDQVLHGTTLVTVEEKDIEQNNFLYCETSYGYRGFVSSQDIERRTGKNMLVAYIVVSPFCDVLAVPEYKYLPLATLPKGSIVYRKENCFDMSNGFVDIVFEGKTRYVRGEYIKRRDELYKKKSSHEMRRQVVDNALSYIGTPYRWAGKSQNGIDCSGLCFMAYSLCGIRIWRDAVPDAQYVKTINFNSLKQADLIYYKGHMVMYIGAGEYVHSSASQGGVVINSFDEKSPVYNKKLTSGILCCAASVEFEDDDFV